ncbi:unnamed protein product, partial [Didymodactylos carnosus]
MFLVALFILLQILCVVYYFLPLKQEKSLANLITPILFIFTSDKLLLKELIRAWLHFIIVLASFIANCFAEKYDFPKIPGKKLHFGGLISYKGSLRTSDCWELNSSEKTANVVARVQYQLD